MKKITLLILAAFIALVSYAGKPVVKKAEVTPGKVKLGGEVSFSVEFSGKKGDIKSVKLYNQEYPDYAPVIELFQDPDSKGNAWKAVGPIPNEAPMGTYNWEIKAIDKKDKEVVDKKFGSQSYGKTGKLSFEIVL